MLSIEIKNQITQKLQDIGSEFASDSSTLIDFISVMLQNGKNENQLQLELSEVIGISEAKDLVSWLFEALKGQTDSHKKTIPSNRLLQVAIEQASQRTPSKPQTESSLKRIYSHEQVSELNERNVKSKKESIVDRLGPSQKSIKERLGPKSQLSSPSLGNLDGFKMETTREFKNTKEPHAVVPQADVIKCSFWPHCARGDSCLYIHPSKNCFAGDQCNKKADCIYIHPSDLVSQDTLKNTSVVMASIPCKFGISCLKMDCPFQHPSGHKTPTFPPSEPVSTILCKYAPNCLNPLCTFMHPATTKEEPLVQLIDYSLVICKYDPFCSRPGCLYKHGPSHGLRLEPSKKFMPDTESVPSSFSSSFTNEVAGKFKNKTLSNIRHISERGFAVADSETEKVIPMDI